MKARQTLIRAATVCASILVVTVAMGGNVDRAAQSSAEGDALVAKALFADALKAYAKAAKADPENQQYRQQYALIRRVTKMRKGIDRESNPEKRASIAKALRSFYYANELPVEAVALDRKTHESVKTADSAVLLAESLVATNKNAEAVELLKGYGVGDLSVHGRALLGIAYGREGHAKEAKAVADACKLSDDAKPNVVYDVARLRALIGDQSSALQLLARSFESTPPSRLDAAKRHAKECPDWSALLASADFAKTLKTASKVKESDCSSGTNCGNCPSRNKCSKGTTSSHKKKEG